MKTFFLAIALMLLSAPAFADEYNVSIYSDIPTHLSDDNGTTAIISKQDADYIKANYIPVSIERIPTTQKIWKSPDYKPAQDESHADIGIIVTSLHSGLRVLSTNVISSYYPAINTHNANTVTVALSLLTNNLESYNVSTGQLSNKQMSDGQAILTHNNGHIYLISD